MSGKEQNTHATSQPPKNKTSADFPADAGVFLCHFGPVTYASRLARLNLEGDLKA